ncbi:MAG TPA: hypothetical protein VGJ39_09620 [Vicinamibacterales bacterium]|jgi:hypothetical protein
MERPTATPNPPGTSATPSVDAIEQRVIAFAEQLGRLVGTVQARADGWMDVPALQEQVTRIRDGAASLLGQLGAAVKAGAKAGKATEAARAANPAGARSGGKVDAPGKKHRKPAARTRSVKHSDQMISKGKASRQMRRGPNKS